jgi:ABC transport system ATP-binding/permease protein
MSEEILKALMQLFAIISKQDEGTTQNQREYVVSFLRAQLNNAKVEEYMALYDELSGVNDTDSSNTENIRSGKLTSMKDSVRTLSICRKINKTLSQKQKVVVLIRIFELLKAENLYTEQRMGIIETIATVFNIPNDELELIGRFIREDSPELEGAEDLLLIKNENLTEGSGDVRYKLIHTSGLDGTIYILRIKSVDIYFVKYKGVNEISLNGLSFNLNNIYLFPQGSTLRLPKGTIYYSDVVSRFLKDGNIKQISFQVENLSFSFPNGTKALRDINIAEEFGLIGIMGASGSGKTTLLNILSGIEKPSSGSVMINGIDVHLKPSASKGMIGYIAQDDFLFEDLTVYENLYYNAKLCFKGIPDKEIVEKVEETLIKLELFGIKDIRVGSPLNKKISGGQRKRLNIALELIREPSVLFVDEPTSGLSSKDSENVMDLLKELSLNMKLIFVVIHQPSSDIFKMFDRLFILDTGGYPIYYGNPIQSVIYFKTITKQINADVGECGYCSNVNPELLFNVIDAKEVDDFGKFTHNRLRKPEEWNQLFLKNHENRKLNKIFESKETLLKIPSWFKQLAIFIKRDVLSKISNLQYLLINLLEAPLLAIILTVIIKHSTGSHAQYIFKDNDNIPPYIFMSIVIALFIGLSVSAEEIFRDRKILRRESFLNLSRSSYLFSKISILFFLSAFQTLTFVLIGNAILGINGMFFQYWIVLFAVACFANILGLNISASFNSAVTIYILIPLLVIPQMVLGGAMFSFDKLNGILGGGVRNTPPVADIMVSRWAYEAIAVSQFKNNPYQKRFYELEKLESHANYKQVYYIPELEKILMESEEIIAQNGSKDDLNQNLAIIKTEVLSEAMKFEDLPAVNASMFVPAAFDVETIEYTRDFLDKLKNKYTQVFTIVNRKKNKQIQNMENAAGKEEYIRLYSGHYNEFLSTLMRKSTNTLKIIRGEDHLIQVLDPVFLDPPVNDGLSLRAHFYAPKKSIMHLTLETWVYNLLIIWLFTIGLYISLYYDLLSRILKKFSKK